MQLGQCHAVGARIGKGCCFRRAPLEFMEEHAFALALARLCPNEESAIRCSDGRSDRHAGSGEVSQEIRFRPHVGSPACAMMRQAEDVALVAGRNDAVGVVEAAPDHAALKGRCQRIALGEEARDRLRWRYRVDGFEIDQD